MRKIICIFLVLIQLVLVCSYEFNILDYFLFGLNIFLTLCFFKRYSSYKDDLAVLFLFYFIIFSLHLEALFQFQAGSFVLQDGSSHVSAFKGLAKFANEVLFVFYVAYFFLRIYITKNNEFIAREKTRVISDRLFYLFTILSFAVSLFSAYLGVGRMGDHANIVLPFHLNGIMQFYRTDIFPLLIAIFAYDRLLSNKKICPLQIILIAAWAILESFVRFSRSAAMLSFLPLVFMLLCYGYLNKKVITKILLPIVFVGYLLFPIITAIREEGKITLSTMNESSKGKKDVKQHMYLRTFYSGTQFMRLFPSGYNDQDLFCFDRLPTVLVLGGSAVYTTRIVDGVTENALHSSGTTGLMDPLIIGGKGLCFILVFLLVLLAIYIDKRINKACVMYKVVFLMIFKIFVLQKNLTVLLDSEAIQLITSYIIQFIIIGYYYRKYYSKRLYIA